MDKDSAELTLKILKILDDKKALELKALFVGELTTVADYFVIASGTSTTHVKSLCDEVLERLAEEGVTVNHIEGYNSATWILMDYGSIVVHIFTKDERNFYSLERLWGDAKGVICDVEERAKIVCFKTPTK
ncbi:ribosome silencing factor [Thermoanaerobacterium thermosaccharolyticum]|uniref:Ribosomal silencing factor RsfS n=1 Tax=Thermoanaerobacterium thermosaccharolyticum M0795 TaxID=698948 RepID=L0IJ12_THETR|nr:ribosome silencing factor [Thermoanaerobacterium thermosaccharolyticum]AGB18749.1 iojap-like ribosome-associated protein [Thermoanaerobacterium thermosaccharolyticum M0795]